MNIVCTCLFLALLCFFQLDAYCLRDTTATTSPKNLIYLTFAGKENSGSINFERRFSRFNNWNFSYSLGINPFHLRHKISIPFSVNTYLAWKREGRHYTGIDVSGTFYMDRQHPTGWQKDFNSRLFVNPYLAYRYQERRGLLFKAGIGPQVLLDPPSDRFTKVKAKFLPYTISVSCGLNL